MVVVVMMMVVVVMVGCVAGIVTGWSLGRRARRRRARRRSDGLVGHRDRGRRHARGSVVGTAEVDVVEVLTGNWTGST